MDNLALFVRLLMAVALGGVLCIWLLAYTGGYRPRLLTQEQRGAWERTQPWFIGLLGVGAVLELLAGGVGVAGYLLATFCLMGWLQERARSSASHAPGAGTVEPR